MAIEIKVKSNISTKIGKVIDAVSKDTTIQQECAEDYARLVDPWVPYKTGEMAHSYIIEGNRIIYTMPYSQIQYENPYFNHTTTYHPLASYQWDRVAMDNGQNEIWKKDCKEILLREIRKRLRMK